MSSKYLAWGYQRLHVKQANKKKLPLARVCYTIGLSTVVDDNALKVANICNSNTVYTFCSWFSRFLSFSLQFMFTLGIQLPILSAKISIRNHHTCHLYNKSGAVHPILSVMGRDEGGILLSITFYKALQLALFLIESS